MESATIDRYVKLASIGTKPNPRDVNTSVIIKYEMPCQTNDKIAGFFKAFIDKNVDGELLLKPQKAKIFYNAIKNEEDRIVKADIKCSFGEATIFLYILASLASGDVVQEGKSIIDSPTDIDNFLMGYFGKIINDKRKFYPKAKK